MKNFYLFMIAVLVLFSANGSAPAQNNPSASSAPPARQATMAQTSPAGFDLSEYGVRIQPEPRLIVMMAALDAAGFEPSSNPTAPSDFRAQVRKDQADFDPDLRARLRTFYERNKLPAQNNRAATPAEQAARYVSLAFALGPPPSFDAPARTDDLPAGVLEVLDFAPLLREFYRKSGIAERLPAYVKTYQDEGDRLRPATAEMVRTVLSYLHTRPMIAVTERVPIKTPAAAKEQKKNAPQQRFTTRERERRFYIVPDLLGAPGAINFRVIADDYYAMIPPGINPASSELRRAYLQYVIDPIILRYNRDIAARREQIKQVLNESAKATGATVSPDVFLAVSRSLVAAADVRLDEAARLGAVSREARASLDATKDASARAAIVKEAQDKSAAITDEGIAQLADAYERGAVLAFYFAEQLRGIEASGFDIANFFTDMIASFDPAREIRRPNGYKAARERALAARQARLAERASAANAAAEMEAESPRRAQLVKSLLEVERMLQSRQYEAADTRLRALLQEFQGEPRILFALGRTWSLSAGEAVDENVQSQRLNRALSHYRDALRASTADTDRALLSRAHVAIGRILEFLGQPAEAVKEFEAALQIGDVTGGAYKDAEEAKKKLAQPQ